MRKPTDDASRPASKLIGIREVGLWAVLIVAVAFWANIVRGASPGSMPDLDAMIARVLDNGAFDVFAWTMAFARSTGMFEAGPASRRQICSTFLAGAIALAPVRLATGAALVTLAALLLTDRRSLHAGRQVGMILLALAFETVWTSPLLALPHMIVSRVDAKVCAFLFGLLGNDATVHGNVVANVSGDFSIAVWPYCTSSHSLAGVCLAFLVTLVYLGQTPARRHAPWLAVSLAGSILLTEVRLLMLGTSEANYLWWHDGPGASIYVLTALSLAVVFPILAASAPRTMGTLPDNRRVA